jgi:hypothetical protein
VVLLVVITLLTLFAIVGLAFVLYANSEANSSRIFRESYTLLDTSLDVSPQILLNYAMAQLIYGVPDNDTGVYSALRGHDMARNMYGWNYDPTVAAGNADPTASTNIIPFNGPGRLHFTNTTPTINDDDYKYVNYTYFSGDGFLRDPERYYAAGSRPNLGTGLGKYSGYNPPYTYPDLNCMFLSAVKSDGTVLLPSFYRPWVFDSTETGLNNSANPNWTSALGKYMMLRPRTQEMDPSFIMPSGPQGDVQNLLGGPSGNDSIWLDLDFPVVTSADATTKFKPLFAFLVTDLDNRINLNVTGNMKGATSDAQGSNQGWGPWEVNFRQLTTDNTKQLELANIFLGNPPSGPTNIGRYGKDQKPGIVGTVATSGTNPRVYGQVDYDGVDEQNGNAVTNPLKLPVAAPKMFPFPTRAAGIADDPAGYGNGSTAERTDHPLTYDYFNPGGNNPAGQTDDLAFDASNMKRLLYDGYTGNDWAGSQIGLLCPNTFAGNTAASAGSILRHQVTTHSFDVDRPGVMPWIWDPTNPLLKPYLLASNALFPFGDSLNFPTTNVPNLNKTPADIGGDFSPDWRASNSAAQLVNQLATPAQWTQQGPFPGLGKVNLNRTLPDYPADPNADPTGFKTAQKARQNMAADILTRLRAAVGIAPAGDAPTNRWLAQLAVNIVDYIDSDDISTPFYWQSFDGTWESNNNSQVVFGTELPRVVINEAYCEYENDPTDPAIAMNKGPAQKPYQYNFWVELHNPFPAKVDVNSAVSGDATLQNGPNAIYQLLVTPPNTGLRNPGNTTGTPDATPVSTINNWGGKTVIQAADGIYAEPTPGGGGNKGFYVLAPDATRPFPSSGTPTPPIFQPTLQVTPSGQNSMTSTDTVTAVGAVVPNEQTALTKWTFLLQRLACPGRPLQNNPTQDFYNPYITVDYMENVPTYDGVQYADQMAAHTPPTVITNRHSMGRTHPYFGHFSQQRQQIPSFTAPTTFTAYAGQPQHTFFKHNYIEPSGAPGQTPFYAGQTETLRVPLDWLVHLDRQVASPIELLQVSGFKPHELTQQFLPTFTTQSAATIPAGSNPITPAQMSGNNTYGAPWDIRVGSVLVLDAGTASEEVVKVTAVAGGTPPTNFTATVANAHNTAPVSIQQVDHRVPWFDQSRRLFRALEYLETGSRAAGIGVGGRVPGKVNINTIWEEAILQALADAKPPAATNPNTFTQSDVTSLFTSLINSRSPVGSNGKPIGPVNLDVSGYTVNRPFLSLACPFTPTNGDQQYPQYSGAGFGGAGIDDTILRVHPATPPPIYPQARLFYVPNAPHPYIENQLLSKIYNNLTTRSNVFAVWLTVGFFQVTDDSVKPVKLGAEVGLAQNQNIRHRMFCIVDRTNLNIGQMQAAGQTQAQLTSAVSPNFTMPLPQTISVTTNAPVAGTVFQGTTTATAPSVTLQWTIQPGTTLIVDTGVNQETVVVKAIDTSAGKITADFLRSHAANTPITIPGNPGPQPFFDPNDPKYSAVMPYFAILQ